MRHLTVASVKGEGNGQREMDPREDLNELKVSVKHLALNCPMKDPLPGCPLLALRKMPLGERATAVEQMNMETLQEVMRYHSICMRARHEWEARQDEVTEL